jgi:hypothetical protein
MLPAIAAAVAVQLWPCPVLHLLLLLLVALLHSLGWC